MAKLISGGQRVTFRHGGQEAVTWESFLEVLAPQPILIIEPADLDTSFPVTEKADQEDILRQGLVHDAAFDMAGQYGLHRVDGFVMARGLI